MSDLIYGNTLLRNVTIREFSQVPQRDPSNTDVWYTVFQVRVTAIVNAATWNLAQVWSGGVPSTDSATSNLGAAAKGGPYIPGQNVAGQIYVPDTATALYKLQQALSQDRQQFILSMNSPTGTKIHYDNPALAGGVTNNVTVLQAYPPSNKTTNYPDVDNGPKVTELRVVQTTPATITVEFGVKIALSGCGSNPTVLGNRFSQTDDYDEMFKCTRHWRGTLRMATANTKLSDFRATVLPPLQVNFRRKRMHFEQTQDGLQLGYEVEDEEMVNSSPPAPALRITGRHSESTDLAGSIYQGVISVQLAGPRTCSVSDLMCQAYAIAIRKINSGPLNATGHLIFIDHMTFATDLSDSVKSAEFGAQYRRMVPDGKSPVAAANNAIQAVVTPISSFGDIVGYTPGVMPIPGPFGTAGTAGIVACLLMTPCLGDKSYLNITGTPTPGTPPPPQSGPTSQQAIRATLNVVSTISPSLQPGPITSTQQSTNPYSMSQIDVIRKLCPNRIQLPIAASQGQSAVGAAANPTGVIINLGPATMKMIVRMKYERIGAWPDLLQPNDFTDGKGISYAILSAVENKRPPLPNAAGQMNYAAEAEYVFAMSRPPKPGEVLAVGTLPWTVTPAATDAANQTYVVSNAPTIGLAFAPTIGLA